MSKRRSRPVAVFDCNILLQACLYPAGPAAECYRLVERGKVELVVSRATLNEIGDVLQYAEVRRLAPKLSDDAIVAFIERLAFRATLVRRVPHVIRLPRDPDDEIYLDLAVAADATYLVSRDKDLLSLMTSRGVTAKQFRSRTHPLRILDPAAFLDEIGRMS